ncbi:hypothetical protein Tco_1354158 [Tanacetum coccineum]
MQTGMELTLEQTQQGVSYEVSMEILLEPTSNKLMVGDLCDSLRIKLVTTGKKRWCDSIRMKLVPDVPVMRMASTAAKPCQEDSSEFYLITGSIYTDQRGTVVFPMMVAAARRRLFRYSNTVRLSQSDKVFKLKNFKKDATLKLFKSTNQERYKHVSPEVTSSQDGKVTRWRNEIMLG